MSPYEEIGRALLESAMADPVVPTASAVELKRTASAVDTVRVRTLMYPHSETRWMGRVTSRAARHPDTVT